MKKTKLFSLLFSSVLAILLIGNLTACKNNEDDESNSWNNNSKLKYLGIENAKNLYISTGSSPTRSARAGSDGVKKLFKITEEGYTEEVKYFSDDNSEITIINEPTFIQSINANFIIVGFGGFPTWPSTLYLVRKTDGAVYDMGKNYNLYTQVDGFKNINAVRSDKNDNLYYRTETGKLIKVSNIDSESVISTVCSASTDLVRNFDVDKNGNIVYYANLESDTNTYISRIIKANGGVYNLPSKNFWLGVGHNNFFVSDLSSGISKIEIDNSFNVTEARYSNSIIPTVYLSYKLELKDRLYIVSSNSIEEVENPTATPRIVTLSEIDINKINKAGASENFYYLSGFDNDNKTFFIKINPIDDTVTNLLPKNDYDIMSFSVSEVDGITFNALRMNDGKKIIGKVGINGGDVTIIDEESDVEISYLERINWNKFKPT